MPADGIATRDPAYAAVRAPPRRPAPPLAEGDRRSRHGATPRTADRTDRPGPIVTTIRIFRRPPRPAAVEPAAGGEAPERVRLTLLDQASARRATLDGAWWPRGGDLSQELPGLVEELHRRGVRVTRVGYAPTRWDPAPTRLAADGRVLRLGWFRTIDAQLLTLTGDLTRPRLDLLVLPPDTTAAIARTAFTAATTAGNDRSASALLADLTTTGVSAVPPPPRSPADDRTGSWESEAGRAGG